MFQDFTSKASPEQGPPRLKALRARIAAEGLTGFLVPRADAHQGEYVAARDARLEWLTGFTGSAGFCIVLPEVAGVFIDGRYRTQVKAQVDLAHFTPVPWPDVLPGSWLREQLEEGVIGFDPWLHTAEEIERLDKALAGSRISLRPVADNPVDAIWPDQPPAPAEPAFAHPEDFAGESSAAKRARLAEGLRARGERAAVLTLPDSICWLLNIRGADVPRNPIVQAFAVLSDDGTVALFADAGKFGAGLRETLGAGVKILPVAGFVAALMELAGPVRVDKTWAPLAVSVALRGAGAELRWGDDPCRLPKACKNEAELAGARAAHLRDGAAVVNFLHWLDTQPPGSQSEISTVEALEGFRRATNALHDISFDTISGAGPNGAIMHYRVTEESNRPLGWNELYLVDSGAQYLDGTTDITRTVALGDPGDEARDCYTRVLRGLISLSRVRWPRGLAGRDLDPLARFALWVTGRDFNHGTGHGVGAFLSVHEGPQRIARISEVPLEPGMILSNEPGYYREGAFGIRLENLIVVHAAPELGDGRDQLCFETITFVPFDRRLIDLEQMNREERDWLNAYHAQVLEKIGPRVEGAVLDWLKAACAPL